MPKLKLTYYFLKQLLPVFSIYFLSTLCIFGFLGTINVMKYAPLHTFNASLFTNIFLVWSVKIFSALLAPVLFFSVSAVYSKLSRQSEILALRCSGASKWQIAFPAFLLTFVCSIVAFFMLFYISPWSSKKFHDLRSIVKSSEPLSVVQQGVFSSRFGFTVYANKVNPRSKEIEQFFLVRKNDSSFQTVLTAPQGGIVFLPSQNQSYLRLKEGAFHVLNGPNSFVVSL